MEDGKQEGEVEALTQRVEQLEEMVKKLIDHAANADVRRRRIGIENDRGEVVVALTTDEYGLGRMVFGDGKLGTRLEAGVDQQAGGFVNLFDSRSRPVLGLQAGAAGGQVLIKDTRGNAIVHLSIDQAGGIVGVNNAQGHPVAVITADEADGGGTVKIIDGSGRSIQVPARSSG